VSEPTFDIPSVFLVRINRGDEAPTWLRPYRRIGDAKAQATRFINEWTRWRGRKDWSATIYRIDVDAAGVPVLAEVTL
jgi:hypothetical protein